MVKIQEKLEKIKVKLKERTEAEGIEAKFISTLLKMWHDFLYVQESGDLRGDELGWSAALYYILINLLMEQKKSQAECAKIFGISKNSLGKKYRKIKKDININDYKIDWSKDKKKKVVEMKILKPKKLQKEDGKQEFYYKAKHLSLQKKRKIKPIPLSDDILIKVFKQVKDLIGILYQEKDYFEIKRFLQYVGLNLTMSGYEVDQNYLEEKFGELFTSLKMVPKKGRWSEMFVHLKDKYGHSEPFVLIKLRG